MISQEELKHALYYDNVGGVFYWRNPPYHSRFLPWKRAGAVGVDGYEKIQINGRSYRSNRLAWLYMHGSFPTKCLDHINGVKLDNREVNLREASKSENNFNIGMYKNNTSGVKGVHWSKSSSKWRAAISANGKRVDLGMFKTIDEAKNAIESARISLHGEFANQGRALAAIAKQGGADHV